MKRLSALVLAAAMLLMLLIGCGASQTAQPSSIQNQEAPAEEVSEAAAPEADAEPAPAVDQEPADAEEESSVVSPEDIAFEGDGSTAAATINMRGLNPADPEIYPLSDGSAELTAFVSDMSSPNQLLPKSGQMDTYELFDYAYEQTGVKLVMTIVSMMTKQEQTSLMLASGEYPDIMSIDESSVSGGFSSLLAQDVIVDLAPNIKEYMPNCYQLISADNNTLKACYNDEGNMPALYGLDVEYVANQGFVIRKDLVDDMGLELPTTINELHEILLRFKQEYDIEAPMWLDSTCQAGTRIAGAMGTPGAWGKSKASLCLDEEGNVISGLVSDEYKEYLKMISEWYSEGLFLSDFWTHTQRGEDQTYFGEGRVALDCAMFGGALTIQNTLNAEVPGAQIYGIPDPMTDDGKMDSYFTESVLNTMGGICVSGQCDDVELAMRYMDWWYSYEGFLTNNYGVEGISFEFDENGEPKYTELITENDWGVDASSAIENYVLLNPVFGVVYKNRSLYLTEGDWVAETLDIWREQYNGDLAIPEGVKLTAEESSSISGQLSDIYTYVSENIIKFVIGDLSFDADWDDYVNSVEALGLQDCIDVYNDAYQRYLDRIV